VSAHKASDDELRALARKLRSHTLVMISRAKTSHIGSCLSVADILAVLYGRILRFDPKRPTLPSRDRLIVSKGHAAAIVYAAVAEAVAAADRPCLQRAAIAVAAADLICPAASGHDS